MNRVILIGNGFDLAHGMKTSYYDFIFNYVKSSFLKAQHNNRYSDELMTVSTKYSRIDVNAANDLDFFFDFLQSDSSSFYISGITNYNRPHKAFEWNINNGFISNLIISCKNCNWVDIENEYYENLKNILKLGEEQKDDQVKYLNEALQVLISKLEIYLQSLKIPELDSRYKQLFKEKIYALDVVTGDLKESQDPAKTMILNFNYTNIFKSYFEVLPSNITLNNIHGQLGDKLNPIIFGFGDEMDKDYGLMEIQRSRRFMHFFKSFGYHMTPNYHDLIRFLNEDFFQVYILGHSCGLSDRTMLNMIFEHSHCRSIKVFYHENNFKDLTMEISRHFHNKGETRKLIVNYTKSQPMPQV